MARTRRPEKPQTQTQQDDPLKGAKQLHSTLAPYYKHIGIGIGVVVFVVLIIQIFAFYSASYQRGGWLLYFAATSPSNLADIAPEEERLNKVAKDYPKSTAALWSKLLMADEFFVDGTSQLISNRSEAIDQLKQATDLYSEVAEATEGRLQQIGFKLLHLRALLGQAKAQEAIGKSSTIEQAIALYAQVEKEVGSPYALEARRRRESLQKESTREFYNQFAEVKPQETPPPLDLDDPKNPFGSPPKLPNQGPDLPDIDLSPDSMDNSGPSVPGFPDFSADPAEKPDEEPAKDEPKQDPTDDPAANTEPEEPTETEEKSEPADEGENPEEK